MEAIFKTRESISETASVETVPATVLFKGCSAYIAKERVAGARATVVFTNPAGDQALCLASTEMTPLIRNGSITLQNLLSLNVLKGEKGDEYYFCKPTGGSAIMVDEVKVTPLTIAEYTMLAAL